MKKPEWFASWFDTPYYHILYRHRDFKEAEIFINNLFDSLHIPNSSSILDLACGRGRHAYFMAKKGYEVTGLDLSVKSINWARKEFKLDSLQFDVHDMREAYPKATFDYVFNFFTSFGYFESNEDNQQVVNAMKTNLKDNGYIVIDFLNVVKSLKNLEEQEEKEIEGITFFIKKKLEKGVFIKEISFQIEGVPYNYEEKVQALNLDDFEVLFSKAGLKIEKVYGNYALEEYDMETADRLIMVLRKND